MTGKTKRITVYLDEDLHRALKIKAAEKSQPVSSIINKAVRDSLVGYSAEDTESWLEESFNLMDQAEVNSGGVKWKREDLYDV